MFANRLDLKLYTGSSSMRSVDWHMVTKLIHREDRLIKRSVFVSYGVSRVVSAAGTPLCPPGETRLQSVRITFRIEQWISLGGGGKGGRGGKANTQKEQPQYKDIHVTFQLETPNLATLPYIRRTTDSSPSANQLAEHSVGGGHRQRTIHWRAPQYQIGARRCSPPAGELTQRPRRLAHAAPA